MTGKFTYVPADGTKHAPLPAEVVRMTKLTDAQYNDRLAAVQSIDGKMLHKALLKLCERAWAGSAQRDGYPASSGPTGGSRSGDVSDPTFDAATSDGMRDPVEDAYWLVRDVLPDFVAKYDTITSCLRGILALPSTNQPPGECSHHANLGYPGKQVLADGLCRWCYDYRTKTGQRLGSPMLPSREEAEAHESGRLVRVVAKSVA